MKMRDKKKMLIIFSPIMELPISPFISGRALCTLNPDQPAQDIFPASSGALEWTEVK